MARKKRRKSKDAMDRVTDLDLATALFDTVGSHAADVDRGTQAREVKDVAVWWFNRNRLDFKGVDTPLQKRPKTLNRANALRKARREGLI